MIYYELFIVSVKLISQNIQGEILQSEHCPLSHPANGVNMLCFWLEVNRRLINRKGSPVRKSVLNIENQLKSVF